MVKYSIILPVRNGGEYVKECVNSILTQSLQDFEFIVLENCSTDNTLYFISSFNDNRIKIYPADKPLQMEENWQRVLKVPKKEFMTLIGHDEMLDKDYLYTMNDLIYRHPQASLYHTHFRYIDSAGKEIGKCKPMKEIQKPVEVIHNFFYNKTDLMGTGFMMRSHDYEDVGGIPLYPNLLFADMELFIELSRKAYLAVDKQECFSYRRHAGSTTSSSSDARFLQSFDLLITYLSDLKKNAPLLAPFIERDSSELLRQYCQTITHRILRTPKCKRETPPVADIIDQFRGFGKKMGNDAFEPLDFKMIQIGKAIDSNSILRSLFLGFKKIFPKPLIE